MWLIRDAAVPHLCRAVARFDQHLRISLAAVVVLMLWLMVSAWALLLGARLNAEAWLRWCRHRGAGRMTDVSVQIATATGC